MTPVYKWLNRLFYRKLCLNVDRPRSWHNTLRHRCNYITGRIAWYFHQKYCRHCAEERARLSSPRR